MNETIQLSREQVLMMLDTGRGGEISVTVPQSIGFCGVILLTSGRPHFKSFLEREHIALE